MESNQPNEPKPVQWRTLKLFIIACGFVALVTVLFPILFFRQGHDHHPIQVAGQGQGGQVVLQVFRGFDGVS